MAKTNNSFKSVQVRFSATPKFSTSLLKRFTKHLKS